jgi:hypothetical protein
MWLKGGALSPSKQAIFDLVLADVGWTQQQRDVVHRKARYVGISVSHGLLDLFARKRRRQQFDQRMQVTSHESIAPESNIGGVRTGRMIEWQRAARRSAFCCSA